MPTSFPPRRAVLRGLGRSGVALAAGVALSACGLRWEADAPDLPVLPRDRYPGADALHAEAQRVAAARGAVAEAGSTELVAMHGAQLAVLTKRLVAAGALARGQADELAASTPIATPDVADDAAREIAAQAEWAGLAAGEASLHGAGVEDALLIGSIQVARAAAGRLLGGRWAPPSPGDGIASLDPEIRDTLLPHLRGAQLTLQLIAAQGGTELEDEAAESAAVCERLMLDLSRYSAEGEVPPPALGAPWTLPASPEEGRTQAGAAMSRCADAFAAAMPGVLTLPVDREAENATDEARVWTALRRRAAECEEQATAWSGRVRPLPGVDAEAA